VKRVEKVAPAGLNMLGLEAVDDQGRPLPAGLYLARLEGSSRSCKFEIIR